MMVVDTSALMAVLLNEAEADAVAEALARADAIAISAASVAEALIVATARGVGAEMRRLIEGGGFEIVALTPTGAERVAAAYGRWGKGVHPAGLNFGDCFAYALAEERGWPLLFVGADFARTDIAAAL